MSENPIKNNDPPPEGALYYNLVAECLKQHKEIPNRPGHIFFAVEPGADIPKEILEIQAELENTTRTIRQLYEKDRPEVFKQLFEELLCAAKLLAGPKPSPFVVSHVLQRFQERIVSQEGKAKKTKYMNGLAWNILGVIGVITILFIIVRLPPVEKIISSWVVSVAPYYAVLFGTATAAMWLSFASRKPRFSFDDLLEPERDMLGPRHRIAYVLLFAAVLALFSEAEFVGTISIGSFSTEKISSDFMSAAIFGFACGFSEKLLASTVAPHVSQVIGGLSKTR